MVFPCLVLIFIINRVAELVTQERQADGIGSEGRAKASEHSVMVATTAITGGSVRGGSGSKGGDDTSHHPGGISIDSNRATVAMRGSLKNPRQLPRAEG
jgi:hypothetical protein